MLCMATHLMPMSEPSPLTVVASSFDTANKHDDDESNVKCKITSKLFTDTHV